MKADGGRRRAERALNREIAIPFDVRRKVERVLSDEPLCQFGVAVLQRLDDPHLIGKSSGTRVETNFLSLAINVRSHNCPLERGLRPVDNADVRVEGLELQLKAPGILLTLTGRPKYGTPL